jgi:uncharacterized protein (TIGR03437 family)
MPLSYLSSIIRRVALSTSTLYVAWLFLFPGLILARQDQFVCGTSPTVDAEENALYQAWTKSVAFRRATASAVGGAQPRRADRNIGNIAVLEDSGDLVNRRNPFDLVGRTVRFLPQNATASSYRYDTTDASYDASLASGTALPLGDDETVSVALPFTFPFFQGRYSTVFVNSDGNLTFGEGDKSTDSRAVSHVVAGAPRIAVLFHDMDPSRRGAAVTTSSGAGVFTVSWVGVPRFGSLNPPQTFQVRLYSNGRIEMAYESAVPAESVVGIAPGQFQGSLSLVKFRDPGTTDYTGALLERFQSEFLIDMSLTAQRFFETHDDAYDFLAIYNNMNVTADGGVAFSISYKNAVTGINQIVNDLGYELGGPRRVQTLINMGQLSQYAADPNAKIVSGRANTGDSGLSILAHEVGHRFLAYASVPDPSGGRPPMLQFNRAHWAFTFNAEASFMEGVRLRDNGEGTSPRFLTTATVEGFSPLDLYLMGLARPQEVPPSFYVTNTFQSPDALPARGIGFDGTRRDVTIEDLVAAQGPRVPDSTVSPRRFRIAFVLLTAAGTQPTAADLAKLEAYRSQFESYFAAATGGRATIETQLKKSVDVSVWPAAGVVEGATRTVKVEIAAPAQTALTLSIQALGGNLAAPQSVTIPAGARSAQFEVRGTRAGVGELRVEPGDPGFGGTTAYVQVLAAANLRLAVSAGDKQVPSAGKALALPVRFRVTDANRLGYEGITVRASATTGTVTPTTATSDASGTVSFVWTPAAGGAQTLTATLEGGASAQAITDATPFASAAGIVNAASFAEGVVPGAIATVFGSNLAGGQVGQAAPPLPTELAGVTATIDGVTAQLFYVSDGQVNLLVPPSLTPGTAILRIRNGSVSTADVRVSVLATQPGIFQNAGAGAVLVYPTHLEIYATGLGAVAPGPSGLNETILKPEVTLGGQALDVLYSGPAPTFPGLYQVNVRRPAGAGTLTMRMRLGGLNSNTVNVTLP